MEAAESSEMFRAKVNLDTAQIRQWRAAGKFGKVTDEQASAWMESDAMVWAVVISPWVLVQPAHHLQ
ncbi:MAG: DUF2288 family protein [Gallionella sp.]